MGANLEVADSDHIASAAFLLTEDRDPVSGSAIFSTAGAILEYLPEHLERSAPGASPFHGSQFFDVDLGQNKLDLSQLGCELLVIRGQSDVLTPNLADFG